MKNHSRFVTIGAVLLILIGFLIAQPVFRSASAQDEDAEARQLYNDPERFQQLSGAAQTMLELRFGPRTGHVFASVARQEESVSDVDPSGISPVIVPPAGKPGKRARGDQQLSILSTPQAPGSVQLMSALANPPVNDPSADTTVGSRFTQSETTIVLGSGTNVISSFNDSGSFALVSGNKFTGFSRSVNMGATWTDGGTLPTNTNGDAGDPVLARDNAIGRTYLATLQFSGSGVRVFRSDDDALTWMAPTQGAPGKTGTQDKEWIAVDNFSGSGNGNVYLVERDFGAGNGIYFFRSIDNGATFGPSGGTLIVAGNQGAFVAVGPSHEVYAFYWESSAGQRLRVRKSTDQGLTFAAAVTVTSLLTTGVNGDIGLEFRSSAFPHAAVNPVNGNVYVVYNDNPAGVDRGDVFFSQSTDGGATWGAAVRVNTDTGTNDNWQPTIAVKPDGSALAISWYDRRLDPANNRIQYWSRIGNISGGAVTFGPDFRISPPFSPRFGVDSVVNPTYMGDYDQMVADNSFFYATWGDNRLASAPDVRFAKIPMAGPGPTLDAGTPAITGGDGDGNIEPNECHTLIIPVTNDGTANATGIVGVLSTSTPGVTVSQNTSTYPNLAPGATGTNATPYEIDTSPSFVCSTTIVLTLSLTYNEGSDTSTITLPTCQCPPTTITGSIAAGDPQQTGRLFRNGVASTCAVPKATPTLVDSVARRYDAYTFTNGPAPTCVTVSVTSGCSTNLYYATYLGSFNPANIQQNYLADPGASFAGTATWSFNLPAGATFVLAIHEVAVTGCASYSATLSGLICGSVTPGITCPANIGPVPNDPGQCCAVVTYATPTSPGGCAVTCTPASGTCFPVGTTTVTCSTPTGDSCLFTVTVIDTQPPVITCPANQTAVTNQNVCPSPACQVVNYAVPVASDNCPGVGVVCNPPSGSCFPTGVTTVTCTATDTSGNTATCSFTVTTFDVALQDDSNPAIILLWNSITGQYRFCCNGTTYTGIGTATRQGCVYTLQTPTATDRRILGRHDKAVHAGSGSLQAPPGAIRCTITDRNTLNDTLLPACQ